MRLEEENMKQSHLGEAIKIVRGIQFERVQNLSNLCHKEIVFTLVEESCNCSQQFDNISPMSQMCHKHQSQVRNQDLEDKSRNF